MARTKDYQRRGGADGGGGGDVRLRGPRSSPSRTWRSRGGDRASDAGAAVRRQAWPDRRRRTLQDNRAFDRFLEDLPREVGAEAVIGIFAGMFPDVGEDVGTASPISCSGCVRTCAILTSIDWPGERFVTACAKQSPLECRRYRSLPLTPPHWSKRSGKARAGAMGHLPPRPARRLQDERSYGRGSNLVMRGQGAHGRTLTVSSRRAAQRTHPESASPPVQSRSRTARYAVFRDDN